MIELKRPFRPHGPEVRRWEGIDRSSFIIYRCADGWIATCTWEAQSPTPTNRSWGDVWISRHTKQEAITALVRELSNLEIDYEKPIVWEERESSGWWLDVSRIEPKHIFENLEDNEKRSALNYKEQLWFAEEGERRLVTPYDLLKKGVKVSIREEHKKAYQLKQQQRQVKQQAKPVEVEELV